MGIPAVFCSDSTTPLLIEIEGNKLPVAITEACLAFLVLSIAFSRFIFSSMNSFIYKLRLSSSKLFHQFSLKFILSETLNSHSRGILISIIFSGFRGFFEAKLKKMRAEKKIFFLILFTH